MENNIDISVIIEDVSNLLKDKLINAISPIINEKQQVDNLLLNMPSIQNILKENIDLKEEVIKLNNKLDKLRNKYKEQFLQLPLNTNIFKNQRNKNIQLEIEELSDKDNLNVYFLIYLLKILVNQKRFILIIL